MNYETINPFKYAAPEETIALASRLMKLSIADVTVSKAICPKEGVKRQRTSVRMVGVEPKFEPPHPNRDVRQKRLLS
jgi:hypothetical protein